MSRPDVWIVGQGIAGTLLAHFLLKNGRRPLVIDDGQANAATRIAAGIMNPVTGRHFSLTWMANELFPFARETYREIEELLGEQFYFPYPVVRALPDVPTENEWFARAGDPELAPFIGTEPAQAQLSEALYAARAYVGFAGGGKCALGDLTSAYRNYLKDRDLLRETAFDYAEIDPADPPCPVVFCEGARGLHNPWFGARVPFRLAKGEVLIVRIPDYPLSEIIVKHDIFIVPLGNDLFWVGSNYEQRFSDELPSAVQRAEMEAALQKMLRLPYEVVEHRAAVRPTTANRRPFFEQHPDFPQLFVFNGLGTKGATLGPYWARAAAQQVCAGLV